MRQLSSDGSHLATDNQKKETPMSAIQEFLAARDFLLRHRSDYATAYKDFRWPRLEHFNWALDYFDALRATMPEPGAVDRRGRRARGETELCRTLRPLQSRRQLAAPAGGRRGDRVLVMLGNEVPLWETMLAAIKLGAVVIPATTC
jgi:acetyl-CoA synthetase